MSNKMQPTQMSVTPDGDLISRRALIEEYDRVHIGPPGGARRLMENAPAVDAVEVVRVVRCSDCVWFSTKGYEENNEDKESGLEFGHCRSWNRETQACVFCSHGERRNGE